MVEPRTVPELFRFYHEIVKPLYAAHQIENELSAEVLFEIHASLDHLSRIHTYNEPEPRAVEKAYSHLKRSCLDVFKLIAKRTIERYQRLLHIDTSIIDNGEFDRNLHVLVAEIKTGATEARRFEGRFPQDDPNRAGAFDLWMPVFERCSRFDKEFWLHPKLDWARRKQISLSIKTFVLSVIASLVAGVLLTVLTPWGQNLAKWAAQLPPQAPDQQEP